MDQNESDLFQCMMTVGSADRRGARDLPNNTATMVPRFGERTNLEEPSAEHKDTTTIEDALAQNMDNRASSDIILHVSDIILHVSDKQFYVHKMVLSAWSNVFHKIVADLMWTTNTETVYLDRKMIRKLQEPEDCVQVFESFLKFMYTGKINLTDDNVFPILTLADKYIIPELKDFGVQYLLQSVDTHSIKSTLETLGKATSAKFTLTRVIDKCLDVLATYFQQMTRKYLALLTMKEMIQLLGKDDVVVNDEFMLFKKVDCWYVSNSAAPQEDEDGCSSFAEEMKRLLSLIRFEHMSSSQLKEVRSRKLGAYIDEKHPELLKDAFRMRVLLTEGTWTSPNNLRPPRLYLYFHLSAMMITTAGINEKLVNALRVRTLPVVKLSSASEAKTFMSKNTDTSLHRFAIALLKDHGVYVYNPNVLDQSYCDVFIGCYSNATNKSSICVLIEPDETNRGRSYRLVASLHPVRKEKGRTVILTRCGVVGGPPIRLTTDVKLGMKKDPKNLSVCLAMFVH